MNNSLKSENVIWACTLEFDPIQTLNILVQANSIKYQI